MSCNNDDPVYEKPIDQNPEPLSEEELLNKVQEETFKYFWDYAETNSGCARERYHTDQPSLDAHVVTTGGTGFGLMNILVGVERGFVSRNEAVTRLQKILSFLQNADRFHGAWSHWINGSSGKVIPFGTVDNGGDIVETAFLCEGLICIREYFKNGTTEEQNLATFADTLWKSVEWDWYTKGENVLYWHWSPQYEWELNHQLSGFDETLITYVLAAASPTHPIMPEVYHEGWASNGTIVSYVSSYGIPVVLDHNGTNTVGPLFWSHYSFMGLNPNGLSDTYANYKNLVKNHTDIMYAYCIDNPNNWSGYGENCWGLTASYTRNEDGTTGYSAHQPNNDRGVISPTAALSSYPYNPVASLKFLRYLYEQTDNKYIGISGPYDAFSPQYNWKTPRYLAIDQGPIAPMIENYRTRLLWDLFMNAPDIQTGLTNLGFQSSIYDF